VDVSTLGKIDIQGPDAAEFLDFVYSNTFSTLKPGRVRYGLMLREDGHVMDDGTTARLGETHYVMTTTTAAAGQVMNHLEFVHQCLRPDLDVALISTTEQWAQFSVAGPKARELVNSVLDEPIDNESFPFMACGEVTIHGIAGGFSASPSPANMPMRSRSRRAMARRFSATWWPVPRHGRRGLRDGGAERTAA
jgi:glycine cleavage system aminomethyltransferase T